MKTTLLILFAASAITSGCATARGAADPPSSRRGEVRVTGTAARAVTVGPATIHAYSEFAGGDVFTVPIVTGGDADCLVNGSRHGAAVKLGADDVVSVAIDAGSVACVAARADRKIELLWHVREDHGTSAAVLMARRP